MTTSKDESNTESRIIYGFCYKQVKTQLIWGLKAKSDEINNQIGKVGNAMSSPVNINEVSLDVQNELLAGQSTAVKSFNMLTSIMSQALKEESRYQQVVLCISSRDTREICVF